MALGWVGRWWYWGDYPAHSFALDELRLERSMPLDTRDYRPTGDPLERVLAKLRAGKPVTVVTMGDSLTDFRHWANRETSWPVLLRQQLEKKYGSAVTLVNPAIGGTQLRQGLVLTPRWLARAPEPELVTFCFGGKRFDEDLDENRKLLEGRKRMQATYTQKLNHCLPFSFSIVPRPPSLPATYAGEG